MTRYRADPPAASCRIEAEGMTLLFHRPSGTTHVLLPPAPEILDLLAAGPADAAGVAVRIADTFAMEDGGATVGDGDGPIAAIVAARLDELAAAGLVERLAGGL